MRSRCELLCTTSYLFAWHPARAGTGFLNGPGTCGTPSSVGTLHKLWLAVFALALAHAADMAHILNAVLRPRMQAQAASRQ